MTAQDEVVDDELGGNIGVEGAAHAVSATASSGNDVQRVWNYVKAERLSISATIMRRVLVAAAAAAQAQERAHVGKFLYDIGKAADDLVIDVR